MKTIYAVNSGTYSDYRVVALFTTEELAQEFMDAVPDDDYNAIEEYELNPNTTDLIKRGYSLWGVRMLRDGSAEMICREEIRSYSVTNTGATLWKRSEAPFYKGKGVPDVMTANVWAKNEQGAIKVANEKRIQMIANGEWSETA